MALNTGTKGMPNLVRPEVGDRERTEGIICGCPGHFGI